MTDLEKLIKVFEEIGIPFNVDNEADGEGNASFFAVDVDFDKSINIHGHKPCFDKDGNYVGICWGDEMPGWTPKNGEPEPAIKKWENK